jgi:fructoselysine-6-P-deglycase FrlB-like protein
MSELPTKDPTVAVLIERMARLSEDFATFREDAKAENAALRKEIGALKAEVAEQSKFFTKASGGFWVIVTIGGFTAWGLGIFEKIWKLFH